MPRRSSWARSPSRSPLVERPVAAARPTPGHHLELGERTHAGAAKARIVEAAPARWIGDRPRFGCGDEDEIAFAHAVEELAHIVVRQAHAAMGDGPAEQTFVVGAMEIDVARQTVPPLTPIHAVLEPVEGEDAGEDQIVVARLSAPHLAAGLARDEDRARRRVCTDPLADAVPARRRSVRVLLAADAGPRGGHRPGRDSLSGFEEGGDLALWVDHEQARGQGGRRAGAGEAFPRKIESAGRYLVGRSGHARTLPYRERAGLPSYFSLCRRRSTGEGLRSAEAQKSGPPYG